MIKELTPSSIKELQCLVDTFDVSFENIKDKIINVLILPRIDEIEDENLLDLLGWQFHIEEYNKAQDIQEKKALIKNAIELHRHKGTLYAIKKVLEIFSMDTKIYEWFQSIPEPYNLTLKQLKPYEFVAVLNVNRKVENQLFSQQTQEYMKDLINEYKNVRSHLAGVILEATPSTTIATPSIISGYGVNRCELEPNTNYQMNGNIGVMAGINSFNIGKYEIETNSNYQMNGNIGIVAGIDSFSITQVYLEAK
jgi:phage tail P2-like protein